MNHRLTNSIFALGICLTAVPHARAAVSLQVAPRDDAAIVATIADDSAILDKAVPVEEKPLAAKGWFTVGYRGDRIGYVPADKVSKNYAIENDTPVYETKESESRILTRSEAGDIFEAIASEDEWITVRFSKTVPVFFKKKVTPPQSINTLALPSWESALDVSTDEAATSDLGRGYQFNPSLSVGETAPEELPPENVTWGGSKVERPLPQRHLVPRAKSPAPPAITVADTVARPNTSAPIVVEPSNTFTSEVPRKPAVSPGTPTRTLMGTLKREIKSSGPRYPLQLKSSFGGRIAYIDMSKLFISDLRPFLNRPVSISGEVYPLVPGSSELIIQARTIRLAE